MMATNGEAVSLESSARYINILIVIDTDYVKATYKTLSTNSASPTFIPNTDTSCQFMIVTGSRGPVTDQGKASPKFSANPNDTVVFFGQSVYGNSDDAVIIYGIRPYGGSLNVFNPFHVTVVERNGAAFPNENSVTDNGLPATHAHANFISLNSTVRRAGEELFYVDFGLYTLDDKGETQNLLGYYSWEPKITVL
jgi:hypothetical protein